MVEIMDLMPADVYAAIDMNHIKNPERLIAALGSRINCRRRRRERVPSAPGTWQKQLDPYSSGA
jgi:hypothetical protein